MIAIDRSPEQLARVLQNIGNESAYSRVQEVVEFFRAAGTYEEANRVRWGPLQTREDAKQRDRGLI